MRIKTKMIEEINDFIKNSEFEINKHKGILDHLDRQECPYCASPILIKGNINIFGNNLLVKRLCFLSKNKNSFNVKNAIHLIIKDNDSNQEFVFLNSNGNPENVFVYDED